MYVAHHEAEEGNDGCRKPRDLETSEASTEQPKQMKRKKTSEKKKNTSST